MARPEPGEDLHSQCSRDSGGALEGPRPSCSAYQSDSHVGDREKEESWLSPEVAWGKGRGADYSPWSKDRLWPVVGEAHKASSLRPRSDTMPFFFFTKRPLPRAPCPPSTSFTGPEEKVLYWVPAARPSVRPPPPRIILMR